MAGRDMTDYRHLRFSPSQHAYMALQGLTLFSINYILVYVAELYVASGLVAIIFSLIVFFNVFNAAIFLGDPIRPRVLLGAMIGILGLALVLLPGLEGGGVGDRFTLGLGLALAATAVASIGNITSARNQRNDLPVIQTNAYGMGYGALITLGIAALTGAQFSFDSSPQYVLSLIYLAVFGSVIAFGSYLTLLGRIGPDRAAYIMVLFPIVALALSTLFEGLTWSPAAFAGVALVLLGNAIALTRSRRRLVEASSPPQAAD